MSQVSSFWADQIFSSKSVEWPTPLWLFRELDAEFGFDLDVCATPENAKCARYYTEMEDGLSQDWRGVCWMNPPYGKNIDKWVERAFFAGRNGSTVVCLLPARTDRAWWHDYAMKGEVRFIRGRVTFGDAHNPAPFPSVVVVFRPAGSPVPPFSTMQLLK